MSEEILTAYADLATVARLHARIAVLDAANEQLRALIHTRNNQLAAVGFGHELLCDDVRQAIALLPHEPGAALTMLVEALKAQEASQGAQERPGDAK